MQQSILRKLNIKKLRSHFRGKKVSMKCENMRISRNAETGMMFENFIKILSVYISNEKLHLPTDVTKISASNWVVMTITETLRIPAKKKNPVTADSSGLFKKESYIKEQCFLIVEQYFVNSNSLAAIDHNSRTKHGENSDLTLPTVKKLINKLRAVLASCFPSSNWLKN